MEKRIIYQAFARLFGNKNKTNIPYGTIAENGCGKFNDFSDQALKGIKLLGTTDIWFTGVLNHASQTAYPEQNIPASPAEIVKGKAGSPYAIRDYYDVCPDLAENPGKRMSEFEALIQRTHDAGMKVIIDFVPNHVSRVYHSTQQPKGILQLGEHDNQTEAFSPKNNFYYIPGKPLILPNMDEPVQRGVFYEFPAKVTGNDCFTSAPGINDWFETVKLNYGVNYRSGGSKHFDPVPDTWYKMLDILIFWSDKHVDGFRCDMAEMVPVEFWEWCIPRVKQHSPQIVFIAEIYKPELYRDFIYKGKFDYLYDKVGLYDTLRGVLEGHKPASDITRCWQSVDDIKHHMVNFLENHDEQRIASKYFCNNPFAALPALVVSTCMNQNPYMHYFAQELGEPAIEAEGFSGDNGRTTIFDYWGVGSQQRWMNEGKFDGGQLNDLEKKLRALYEKVLNFCKTEKAVTDGNFYDLQWANIENMHYNHDKLFSFLRYTEKEVLVFICNFSDSVKSLHLEIPDDARELAGLRKLCHFKGEEISFNLGSTPIEYQQKEFYKLHHEVEGHDVLIYKICK